jgi:hypothetical protein
LDEDEPPPIGGKKHVQKRLKNSTDFHKRLHKPSLPLPTFPKLEKLVQSIISKPKINATTGPFTTHPLIRPVFSAKSANVSAKSPFDPAKSAVLGSPLTSYPLFASHVTDDDSDQSVHDEDSELDEEDDQGEEDGVYYVDKILQKRVNAKVKS